MNYEGIALRLALDFFVRCLKLPKGITVLDEARKEVDWLMKQRFGNYTLKELIELATDVKDARLAVSLEKDDWIKEIK